ncbi:MAG: hypothetical protein V4594_18600 [Bacteroidota bacterium]
MEQDAENRIIRDYQKWQENEQKFEKIFQGSLLQNKGFLKEKIAFLTSLPGRYGAGLNQVENTVVKVLQSERRKLEKLLYPNFLVRLIQRAARNFRQRQHAVSYYAGQQQNLLVLQKTATSLGFGNQLRQLQAEIGLGKEAFSLALSSYFSQGDSVNFELQFTRDHLGHYAASGLKASLANPDLQSKHNQLFKLDGSLAITPVRAYNLLKGRTLAADPENPDSPLVRLDFSDKDPQGNFRIKTFQETGVNGLKKMIQELPEEFKQYPAYLRSLETSLINGDSAEWLSIKDGVTQKFYIETDPRQGAIVFYDQDRKRTEVDTVLGRQTAVVMQLPSAALDKQPAKHTKKNRNALGC